jgi:16S rRNA U516 pseudouridylate synthase RsuA-like enzyme
VRHPPHRQQHADAKPADDHARKIGLARALSKLGFCSRAIATELVRAGRVTLNNRLRRDPETYRGQIRSLANVVLLDSLTKGVQDGNDFLRVKSAHILRAGLRNSWLQIILEEGKNRHIRRMLEKMQVDVLRLVRVSIGPLALGDLPKGKLRPLTPAEKLATDDALIR